MSDTTDHDTDNQTAAQFHRYVDLPAELRINIIKQFLADFRKWVRPRRLRRRNSIVTPTERLAPFAVVHSEWQHELEVQKELFGSLYLAIDDLPAFRLILNQYRCDCLSKVTIAVYVHTKDITSNERDDGTTNDTQVKITRTCDFVVNSVARVLDSVGSATSSKTRSAKAWLKLRTLIITPADYDNRGLDWSFWRAAGMDCDFSQLPPADFVREYTQTFAWYDYSRAPPDPRFVALTPSSLLTLVHRMPNLEHAKVRITALKPINKVPKLQPNACPQLKTLIIRNGRFRFPFFNLAQWIPDLSTRIENLELVDAAGLPNFIRALSTSNHSTESTAWPNLRVLTLNGRYGSENPSYIKMKGDDPSDVLRAMAVGLVSLPRLRETTILLRGLRGSFRLFQIMIKLDSCARSNKLTMWLVECEEPEYIACLRTRLTPRFWKIVSQDQIRAAAADLHAAVWTQSGLDMEVVLPETMDDETELEVVLPGTTDDEAELGVILRETTDEEPELY